MIEVTLTIGDHSEAGGLAQTVMTCVRLLDLGGEMVSFRPSSPYAPVKLKLAFASAKARADFLAEALRMPGVAIVESPEASDSDG